MKKMIKSFCLAMAIMAGVVSTPARAGIPVIDAANLVQSIQQVIAWSEQYRQMYTQIMQYRAMFESMTGPRMLGLIFDELDVEMAVPPETMDLILAVRDARAELDRWENFTRTGMAHTQTRQTQLRRLMDRINSTEDSKDIAELNARISAEGIQVQLETNRILLMQEHMRNQEQQVMQAVVDLRRELDQRPFNWGGR